ncbi:hypothetical protein PILCRDRAFT_818205 [Piloderma croceum F 1598]|uniref:Protein kinase domain-containing protein n=1 Tax=Piloderma croceum (strain F 1598) TaxID=765440 RepID=A0A0C3C4T6_PILCF|nr:hypothetical protein PILCRDRAFT_818205 [Piloderma croceum F 1598]
MLSSTRALQFEPRFPPSSSRTRSYRPARSGSSNYMDATQASTSRLSTPPPKQLPPIPSCISPSSIFYQVLTAPYRAQAHPVVSPSNSMDPHHAEPSIEWTGENPSRDDQTVGSNATGSTFQERHIFTPHGRWAWADGLTVNDTEELMQLESGTMRSAAIKRGTLGSRRITYISKCWKTLQMDRWHGFCPELVLHKEENYLKPLQGDVLPWIIRADVSPGAINIAMEPPHPSFWIEASPDMPIVLKQRCIEAFEKIHARGVLHGNVELRHMLIGGDGKVTIIDFHISRVLVPRADVMILPAEPNEFKLEMRKVKYKLDYARARKRETEKMNRREERDRRIRLRQIEGVEAYNEDIMEEDIVDPPVEIQDWNENWANATANAMPTRFVMPGQSSEAFMKESRSFLAILDRMSRTSSTRPHGERRQVRFSSEVTSAAPVNSIQTEEFVEPSVGSSTHSYGIQKRKRSESSTPTHDTRIAKHPRPDGTLTSSTSMEEEEDEPIHPGLCADPILVDYMANHAVDKDRFTPPRVAPDVVEPPNTIPTNPSPSFPPIKVRDFAYEPYDGPRGYYAPYPLMESVVSLHRRRWVRLQNEQRCTELGLPPPRRSTPRTSNTSTRKQSKSDKHIMQLALGLNTIKRLTVVDTVPAKRKRGDEETEMSEADFADDDRRAKKVLMNTDRNARPLSIPVAGPSSEPVGPHRVPERSTLQQARERGLHEILGPRYDQLFPPDRVTSRTASSKCRTAGDRIAFATLGRPPKGRSNSKADGSLSTANERGAPHTGRSMIKASQFRGATPPRRKKSHLPGVSDTYHFSEIRAVRPTDRYTSPSEDEVEAILLPSRMAVSPPPPIIPLGSWLGFLFRWIQ